MLFVLLASVFCTGLSACGGEPAGEEQPQQYTITFNTDGGSSVAPITKKAGESVTDPTPPEREGFTFEGWFEDDGTFAVPYTFSVMPAQNITL